MQVSTELRLVGTAPGRVLLLAAVFLAAAAVAWSLDAVRPATSTARWPTDDAFYAVPGWAPSAPTIEAANGNTYITRRYQAKDGGSSLNFTVTTSQDVKTVYRAGADVPFLGNGYESVAISDDLKAGVRQGSVSQVQRGNDGWVQVYAYGERRGLTGNGAVGWSFAVFDTVLGQPKDYYLLRVLVPTANNAPEAIRRASEFADVLFPRVTEWYAR